MGKKKGRGAQYCWRRGGVLSTVGSPSPWRCVSVVHQLGPGTLPAMTTPHAGATRGRLPPHPRFRTRGRARRSSHRLRAGRSGDGARLSGASCLRIGRRRPSRFRSLGWGVRFAVRASLALLPLSSPPELSSPRYQDHGVGATSENSPSSHSGEYASILLLM